MKRERAISFEYDTETSRETDLLTVPMVGLMPVSVEEGNALLVEWGHRLGPCRRPFRSEAYALALDGRPLAVAISASAVSKTVAGYTRQEVVELARLARHPDAPWVLRVMLRLWREVCAPQWACWPVKAAISYHLNAEHTGRIYRFDGWEKVRDDCGSGGGGSWSRERSATEAVYGRKTLWIWRYKT